MSDEDWLKAKLRLALSLMTQYQRDRFKKLTEKMAMGRGREASHKMGRPKKFQGHTPGQVMTGPDVG